jgi:hypothetical protein
MLKQVLKKSILGYSHYSPSFSIGAEDLVLMHVLSDVKDGFYVDVGAFHPEKHSKGASHFCSEYNCLETLQ